MNPVRIAVIGAGWMGQRHADILLADPAFDLAGIADPGQGAAAYAARHGVSHFADYEPMLDAVKPDGVIVATPNQLHVATTLACIARRIPVLLEKPVADTLAEALRIVRAAEAADVPLMIGHHRRHHAIMRAAADALRSGAIGRVTAVAAIWADRKPDDYFGVGWRTQPGGGPVLINAIHDIDCLRMLCGEIASVQASRSNAVRGHAVEDTAAAILQFESGALGTLVVTDTAQSGWSWDWGIRRDSFDPPQNGYHIMGTRGSLGVPSLEIWSRPEGQGWKDPLARQRLAVVPADEYAEQLRHFAAVIGGTEQPLVSGREGLGSLAVTLAIHESATSGAPVRLDQFLAQP